MDNSSILFSSYLFLPPNTKSISIENILFLDIEITSSFEVNVHYESLVTLSLFMDTFYSRDLLFFAFL